MQAIAKAAAARGSTRYSLVAALIFWLVTAAFFAANPELHRLLHHDAGTEDHECALTIFQKEQVLASDPGLQIVSQPARIANADPAGKDVPFTSSAYNISHGRAPPA